MKTKLLFFPAWMLAVILFSYLPSRAPAQEAPPAAGRPDTAQLLREALFEEQGLRDLDKAAAGYERVIAAYEAERGLAATALYRLAEVRRARNQKEQAAVLYQRLLREFPTHDPLARLSRENLIALGVKEIPGADATVADEQDARIAELKRMLKDSPDIVKGSNHDQPLWMAAEKGQIKVVQFLLELGAAASDRMLEVAAGNGHLSVCEALIAHGADVNNSGALMQAVKQDRMEVLRLCLEKGADLKMWPVLLKAVNLKRTEMVRVLLEKGADPNSRQEGEEKTESALFAAVAYGNSETLDLLIQAKADPNLPPPAKSPLYFAVRNGNVPVAKRLLDIGAEVHVRGMDSSIPGIRKASNAGAPTAAVFDPNKGRHDYETTPKPRGWTLLHAAVMSDNLAMLDLVLPLIKETEDPGHSEKQTALCLAVGLLRQEMAERLLKAGANAKANGNDGLPLLFSAAETLNEGLVKRMLEAGADASHVTAEGRTVLNSLIRSGPGALPLIRLLIAAGADPDKEWTPNAAKLEGAMAVQLAREFQYPKWVLPGQITLSLPESGTYLPVIRNANGSQTPPTLTDLMLEANISWLSIYPPEWSKAHLYRRNAQGQLQQQVLTDWTEGNPPILQWGDIVEFVSAHWDTPVSGRNAEYIRNLPSDLQARLRAALVRHLTVNLEGKSYPMTLRGALKVYNPHKPEAPLTDAVTLIKMMGGADLRWYHAGVRVKRLPEQGGGELTSQITGGTTIPLQEGDVVDLTGDPATWRRNGSGISVVSPPVKGLSNYSSDIFLLSPDLAFSKVVKNSSFSAPTLIQFLATAYPPVSPASLSKLAPEGRIGSVSDLPPGRAVLSLSDEPLQSVLPHPDWSRITIRRVAENQQILEIPVDLASAIAACTDATTPEQARMADVPLMAGDTILLPVRQDRKDLAWTGWDAATIRFFSKALAMEVTLAEDDGNFRALHLEYLPVRYLDTPAGLLGLPAREPAQHLLTAFNSPALVASAAPGRSFAWLQRANSTDRNGIDIRFPDRWFWLKDKDTVGIARLPGPGAPRGQSGTPR